jgi:hypothetical protein
MATNPPWPDPACPFVGGGNDPAWTQPVDEAPWESRKIGEEVDYYKAVACPRCSHNMVVFVAAGAFRGTDARGVPATCTCAEEHRGRPAAGKGCGYGAWISGPGGA